MHQLKVLLWKHLLIRKTFLFMTLLEISIPIVLFTLVAYGRSSVGRMGKTKITSATLPEILTKDMFYYNLPVEKYGIWYTPYSNESEHIINSIQMKFQIRSEGIKHFSSEEVLQLSMENAKDEVIYAVIFKGNDPKKLDYNIRIQKPDLRWNTNKAFYSSTDQSNGVVPENSNYIKEGFVALQLAIDLAFIEDVLKQDLSNVTFAIQEFPYPPHIEDSGIQDLFLSYLPLITNLSIIFLCPAVLKGVVQEKSSGIKEFLSIAGMRSYMFWLGWVFHAVMTNLISLIAMVVLLKVPFFDVPYPPIEFSDGTVLFVYLFLYCMAMISFCFTISLFFNDPSSAMIFGIVFWLLSYFIPKSIYQYFYENCGWSTKVILALFPNMNLHFGFSAISVYESREMAMDWNNFYISGSLGSDDLTMAHAMIILTIVIVLQILLTLYIDKVKPGPYGITKCSYIPSFWPRNYEENNAKLNSSSQSSFIQMFPKNSSIYVHNVSKFYGHEKVVDDVTLSVPKNQIMVLLGENGAGKTTTMGVITGMIGASSGDVFIEGSPITANVHVRRKMGVCPQDNMLFPYLTVIQHLEFFSMLRGIPFKQARSESREYLQQVDLINVRNQMVSTLSGGMKRKLCLGIAVMGNPKILVLDEPTSGVDFECRLKIIELLRKWRESKTVLITTHHMDDAEALGDWIGIMSHGCLLCYDTPLALKTKYNTGMNLSVTLNHSESRDSIANVIANYSVIKSYEQKGIFSILLPLDMDKKHLYQLVEELEGDENVQHLSLTTTTLNDVFLRVVNDCDKNDTLSDENDKIFEAIDFNRSITGKGYALSHNRLKFAKLQWFSLLPPYVVMMLMFLLTAVLTQGVVGFNFHNRTEPELNLNLSRNYYKTEVMYNGGIAKEHVRLGKLMSAYKNMVLQQGSCPNITTDVSESIIQKGIENIAYYKKHMVVAAAFDVIDEHISVNAMYSSSALHSAAISVNLVTNAVLKTFVGEDYSINSYNSPSPNRASNMSEKELSTVEVPILWSVFVSIGMLFFMCYFINFPHSEISGKFIIMKFMSGVTFFQYWLINTILDNIAIFLLLIVASASFFMLEHFHHNEYFAVVEILLLFGGTSLPVCYYFSHKMSLCGAYAQFLVAGLFLTIFSTCVCALLLNIQDQDVLATIRNAKLPLLFVPHFALVYNFQKFGIKYVENYNWKIMSTDKKKSLCEISKNPCCFGEHTLECNAYKSYSIDSLEVSLMIASGFIFLMGSLFWHYYKQRRWSNKSGSKGKVPESEYLKLVSEESNETNYSKKSRVICKVNQLRKIFNKTVAVNNINISVTEKQCLGLLGVNGSGKSTTFQMLSGETIRNHGTIKMTTTKKHEMRNKTDTIEEISIDDSGKYCATVGTCPQFDYINTALSCHDILYTMALIKGYGRKAARSTATQLLKLFELKENQPCYQLSGGEKRKLSTCIAILGWPEMILLDEPTTGVDPRSRGHLWKILTTLKNDCGSSFILSSHSMEECEVLCDTISIMKKGEIVANGPLEELKKKYSVGYNVIFSLHRKCQDTRVAQLLTDHLNRYQLTWTMKAIKFNLIHIEVKETPLKTLLFAVESFECMNYIEGYTLSQSSLEDVFLKSQYSVPTWIRPTGETIVKNAPLYSTPRVVRK